MTVQTREDIYTFKHLFLMLLFLDISMFFCVLFIFLWTLILFTYATLKIFIQYNTIQSQGLHT